MVIPDENDGAEIDGGDSLAVKQVYDDRYGDRNEPNQHQHVQKGHSASSTAVR